MKKFLILSMFFALSYLNLNGGQHINLSSYLSPKAELRTSPIAGKGRFAKEPISKGEIIAIKSGHIITEKQLIEHEAIINGSAHQIADDLYLAPLSKEEFNYSMCYINHSCTPNLGLLGNIISVAMRDIKAGEELCLDYATLFNNDRTFECKCGSENCRNIVTGKDWMIKDLQEKYHNYFASYLLQKINL